MRTQTGGLGQQRPTTLSLLLYGQISDDPRERQKNAHKITLFAQVVPQKPIITMIFGALMTYIILVICGTMGSPNPLKINQVNCGLHNNCTLSSEEHYDPSQFFLWRQGAGSLHTLKGSQKNGTGSRGLQDVTSRIHYMNKHIQICESNNLGELQSIDIGSELGAKLFFSEHFLKSLTHSDPSNIKLKMNITFGIYESNYLSLFKQCKKYNFEPVADILNQLGQMDDYSFPEGGNGVGKVSTRTFSLDSHMTFSCHPADADDKIHYFKKIRSTPSEESSLRLDQLTFEDFQDRYEANMNTTMYSCTTDLALLKKDYDALLYRMIVIQFNEGIGIIEDGNEVRRPEDSKAKNLEQGPDSLYQNLVNVQIVQREPNFTLFKYRRIMSAIFFIASVANILQFLLKVHRLDVKTMGVLKMLVLANLFCLVLYNLMYSFEVTDHWVSKCMDSVVNAMMYSLILFLNLILIDSQTRKIRTNLQIVG